MNRRDMAGDDYGPFDDDYRGFDVREDEAARGPLILTLAIGVLLIFGGVVWNTYRQGVRTETGTLPSIIADAQPFKTQPVDPGGKPVPHTDKKFYDAMDASERAPEIELASAGRSPAPDPSGLAGGPPLDLRPASPLEIQPREVPELSPPRVAEPPAQSEPQKIATVTTRPAEPLEPLSSQARFTFVENGPYLVQVAALRSEEAAETAWRRVTSSAPELYHGANKRIQRADLGSEGVFYRLRAGAFANRPDAVAFCDAIKESGANCIVVTE